MNGPGELERDIERLRADFPALHQTVHGKPLTWLDSAATTHKPWPVLEAMERFYREDNANVHRGVHALSERATVAFEAVREKTRAFLNAKETNEIIFVRGVTEGVNLVANTWGQKFIGAGDEIVLSAMEHHSNIVPWQMLAERVGAKIRVIPMNERGELLMDEYRALLNPRTKLVGVVHVSNALGTVNPVKEIARLAHEAGAVVLADGAQAIAHLPVDVQDLGVDFYALSAHKMYGPTGIGALYGRKSLLEAMPPWQGGGDMIRSVTWEKTTFAPPPGRFEAGTPNVCGVIGMGAAFDYLNTVQEFSALEAEDELLVYGTEQLLKVPGLRLIGTAAEKKAVLGFVLDGVHPHDLGTILDRQGIAIRTGHHCAQPVMKYFGVPATARASLGVYNTAEDIDRLIAGLHQAMAVLR